MMPERDDLPLRLVSKSAAKDSRPDPPGEDRVQDLARDESGEYESLKQLLITEERARIDDLEQRLDQERLHSALISRDLPRAVKDSLSRDKALTHVLSPAVEEMLHDSVRRNPRALADTLYPVMGPSIRRSIAEALRSMIQSLNETLEHSLSWQGLKWRFEALRTNRSFAEVVLLHSLVFRVEQVFLIHRDSGLLLQHVVADEVAFQDADLVSSMLTAVQDFVRDSFSSGNESLDELHVGELQLLILQSGDAILAGTVRGRPPVELSDVFRQTLDIIQREKSDILRVFSGDSAEFDDTRPFLEDCLVARYQKKKQTFPLLPALIALLVLGGLGWWGYGLYSEHSRWQAAMEMLKATPGIVLVRHEYGQGRYLVQGFRDPLAPSPESIVERSPLSPEDRKKVDLVFEPYQALLPEFVLQRANSLLAPPDGVSLVLDDGVLRGTGVAPLEWREQARILARTLQGVTRYDDSGMSVDPAPIVRRAREALAPPEGVSLTMADGVLRAEGVAPLEWRERARILARTLNGVSQYDDSGVSVDSASIVGQAREALAPPEGVSLTLVDGVLRAEGAAPLEWRERARILARTLDGVSRYDDSGVSVDSGPILRQARKVLAPPEGVSLTLADGVLRAEGVAPLEWIEGARRQALALPDVFAYDDARLSPDYQAALLRLRGAVPELSGVTTSLEKGILSVRGKAGHAWIGKLRQAAASIPEITGLDLKGVRDMDLDEFLRLKDRVTRAQLKFRSNSYKLEPQAESELESLAREMRRLLDLGKPLEARVEFLLVGHADTVGAERRNVELSLNRAEHVLARLVALGVPAGSVRALGVGAYAPLEAREGLELEEARANNRRVVVGVEHTPF